MAASTLAIGNAAIARHVRDTAPIEQAVPLGDRSVPHRRGENDLLLAMLSRACLLIERIAARRRAANLARNRVETRRQLDKLPAKVRNDLLRAEQKVIGQADNSIKRSHQSQ